MKKTILLVVLSSLLLTFAGCQQNDTAPAHAVPTQPQTVNQTETASAPSTASSAAPSAEEQSTQPESEQIDIKTLAGVWTPAKAESIASGQEVSFAEAFGSSYGQYGGALSIDEEGNFEIGMGTYNNNGNHKGIMTAKGTALAVTYKNGTADSFAYTVHANGTEQIKARQGEYYVYFER